MDEITDDEMLGHLASSRHYTLVILRPGPAYDSDSPLIWEHGRRNFSLRADGRLAIVGPVNDTTDVSGVGIFTTSPDETAEIMAGDPAVSAGIFTYEVHPFRSFPGDALP